MLEPRDIDNPIAKSDFRHQAAQENNESAQHIHQQRKIKIKPRCNLNCGDNKGGYCFRKGGLCNIDVV